jgi:holo-[acyl-carrier protein] synthase
VEVVGIGTEIIECLRIARMIEHHGERFLRHVYTRREIEYCSSRAHANQHYAGRWAGKMAVLKALGTDLQHGVTWQDIELRPNHHGRANVALGGVARDICVERRIGEILVSISHCRTYATALAIALSAPPKAKP